MDINEKKKLNKNALNIILHIICVNIVITNSSQPSSKNASLAPGRPSKKKKKKRTKKTHAVLEKEELSLNNLTPIHCTRYQKTHTNKDTQISI